MSGALNLFALTSDPSRRVLRFPLSADVQYEVTQSFKQQEIQFNQTAQEELIFDGKYKPDYGECLVINDYDDIDGLHVALASPLSVPEVMPQQSEISAIKAIFSGYRNDQGVGVALIQSFDRRKIISPAGLSIFHSGNVYRKVDGVGITLDAKLAAILSGTTLKFTSFHLVRQIFDLSEYYLEATDADIRDFAAIPSVEVSDLPTLVSMSDSWVRRKVALIKQSQILRNVTVDAIKNAAAAFNITIPTSVVNGIDVILIPQDKADLKKILRFLNEDYYQSPLLNRHYITNSKRLLD